MSTSASKTCRKCKESKPLAAFWVNPMTRDGRHHHCGACLKTGPTTDEVRRRAILAQYGMTPADYDARVEVQGGKCAICRRPSEKLYVDHSHGSGQVRGLLCLDCNLGVGLFGDSTDLLTRAAAYLRRHKT